MKKQQNDLFWQVYANVYDLVRFLPPYKNILRDVKNAIDIRSSDKLLDAGCGTGNFFKFIGGESFAQFVGIDISKVMLAKAKRKLDSFSNLVLMQGDLNQQLPFSDASFDSIIAINSIYAVRNPHYTLSELMRVLKSNGKLVIVNPHANARFLGTYFEILNSGKGLEKILLFFVTIPLFFFNLLIKIKANKKDYHFLSQNDWKKIVKSTTIRSVVIKQSDMQSYLLIITKT